MEKYKQLKVWTKAHQLVLDVYQATKDFPKTELFGLVSQMRRAAVSVAANIVECCKRITPKDRKRFLIISDTSLEELKYYFLLSYNLNYINLERSERLTGNAQEIGRMLNGLLKSF